MGEDYPGTILELEKRFGDDAACRGYLFALRWADGFVCPHCQAKEVWSMSNGRWLCAGCRAQVSVMAGTIFQDSKLPLTIWFRAMWQLISQKNGISALGLQRVLGLGSYKTAWTMLHKLRRAMVRPGRDRLQGVVEVDEAYWGGEEENVRGRQTYEKALIAVAAEADGQRMGRIRLRHIADTSRETLHGFSRMSSGRAAPCRPTGCNPIANSKATSTNGTCKVAGPRKPTTFCHASIWSSHCSSVGCSEPTKEPSPQDYLDEFTFRFNRRNSASRGKLFYRLVQ